MPWFLTRCCIAGAAAFCMATVSPTHTSSAPERPVPPAVIAPAGNIVLTVPAGLISPVDDLPPVLERGHHYQLAVRVWVAGRQPKTFATVTLAGADRSACVVKIVPAGTVVTLGCTVDPTRVGVTGLRVNVVVAAASGVPIVAHFNHPVVATGSSE